MFEVVVGKLDCEKGRSRSRFREDRDKSKEGNRERFIRITETIFPQQGISSLIWIIYLKLFVFSFNDQKI